MSVQGFNFGNGVEKYDFESLDNTPELALQDGNYPDMTAGNADQLNSSMYVEDSVPYLYRTSGGTADIGNREELEIVGGSVVWNQLVQNGNFADGETGWSKSNATVTVSNGVYSATMTASGGYACRKSIYMLANHKYLTMTSLKGASGVNYSFNSELPTTTGTGSWQNLHMMRTPITSENHYFLITTNETENFAEFSIKNVMCVDLTILLGSTIADYIYTLETATAGAGVAKLKSWGFFTKDYYAYDAGSLKSVDGVSSHNMVGFNQWDEEWKAGHINSSGVEVSDSTYRLISKNYIPVLPSTTYCFTLTSMTDCGISVFGYDAEKNFVGMVYDANAYSHTRTFTTGADVHFIKFQMYSVYGQTASLTYNHDICINLSWSGYRNGEYEPYVKHSYPLDSSLTLRGIPKKDDAGNLYFDGDVYSADGTVTRRYKQEEISVSSIYVNANNTYVDFAVFSVSSAWAKTGYSIKNAFGEKIEGISGSYVSITQSGFIVVYSTDNKQLCLSIPKGTTLEQAQTLLNGSHIIYELTTPTTETAEPFQSPQIVNDFGTEEFVTDSIVPVGHNTKYPANLRDKLQHLPSQTGTDGYYAIHEDDGQMTLSPLPAEIPSAPSADGTYVLKATVSSGTVTLTWDAE